MSLKPDTCPESTDVDAAGISVKVTRLTLGDLSSCLVRVASRGAAMGWQKSADVIVAVLTSQRRAEPGERTRPAFLSVLSRCLFGGP